MFKKIVQTLALLVSSSCAVCSVQKDDFAVKYVTFGQNINIGGLTVAKASEQSWTAKLDDFGRNSGPGLSVLEKIGQAAIEKAMAGSLLADDKGTGGSKGLPWYSLNLLPENRKNQEVLPEQIIPPRERYFSIEEGDYFEFRK